MHQHDRIQHHFNSHSHEEDNLILSSASSTIIEISTHILTKRMTAPTIHSVSTQKYFNSHPHEEDDEAEVDENGEELSISTHILTKRMTLYSKRNVTSHSISTHILTKRMTGNQMFGIIMRTISTHILTKRMTRHTQQAATIQKYFNSHPHEEDDGRAAVKTHAI